VFSLGYPATSNYGAISFCFPQVLVLDGCTPLSLAFLRFSSFKCCVSGERVYLPEPLNFYIQGSRFRAQVPPLFSRIMENNLIFPQTTYDPVISARPLFLKFTSWLDWSRIVVLAGLPTGTDFPSPPSAPLSFTP